MKSSANRTMPCTAQLTTATQKADRPIHAASGGRPSAQSRLSARPVSGLSSVLVGSALVGTDPAKGDAAWPGLGGERQHELVAEQSRSQPHQERVDGQHHLAEWA